MKKYFKIIIALVLSMFIYTSTVTPALAITASDCGLKLVQNKSYTKDGKFYMSYTITTGRPPDCAEAVTKIKASLVNSSGKTIFTWSEKTFEEYKTIKRDYSADYSKLPSGTYTMYVTCTVSGREYGGYSWTDYAFRFSSKINHTQTAVINLKSVDNVANDDGSYSNKIVFSHSGAKGKKISLEIYNTDGKVVYKTTGNNPINYDSGTFYFKWSGYPSGGGLKCPSDDYIIKYWLSNGNAKQSTVYLDIY